jgi:hypothetical protein
MPLRVYFGFLGRPTLESREYAVLKTGVIETDSLGDFTVEILCDEHDGVLLLDRAEEFYPDAVSHIQSALEYGCGSKYE